ncbi:aminotransferase class III-fold pyridoxal phosphate-dependent enzyme [Symbioplanes lichenis]|uniref:aminotransferase class III-fold pyridoxal phosphate-dependent enzyme n=1 Tax=Symbioplanes lichenis TaxID=1629072 RepID=UPI0027385E42|nr:aminotransferase class III-fold pyridoxal phosphate-dependent enzyme [Actinoplanes lichenis]
MTADRAAAPAFRPGTAPWSLDDLEFERRMRIDHYGGTSPRFACVAASGVTQRLVDLAGAERGRVFDVLDAGGGYASACLGAGHAAVRAAVTRAVDQAGYTTDEIGSSERARLLTGLFGPGGLWAERFPAADYHVCGRNSGSEGMELALRLALESRFDGRRLRPVPGRGERTIVLAFEGAWHGWSAGVLPLLNRRHHRAGLPSLADRPPYGLTVEHLPFGVPDALSGFFDAHGARLLAVVVEPVQGDAGILLPPAGYLRQLARLCRDNGVLLIADEVLTFARTGRFFAMTDEHGPVPADVTVIGKSLGMGVLSTSMVIARRELTVRASGAVATSDLRPFTCAVVGDGLRHIVAEGLLARSVSVGRTLAGLLERLVADFPAVFRRSRGAGLMHGVELTERAATRITELRDCVIRSGTYVEFMAGAGRRGGSLGYVFPTMRVAPPLVTTPEEAERMVAGIQAGAARFQARL